ncbi:MAG TPA: maleylacetoacetate isomerase [Stellaceae bacterium]|nr:maleylacetoacetate isomerase [Stellaceae bacterium]
MKLYGYFRSSAAFRVRIALNLKGLDYEQVSIHLRKNEQRQASYLALQPQGLVPALEEDDGEVFIQSLAIVEYLDETHPMPPLLPGHPAARARVRALAQAIACDVHPIDNLRVLRYLAKPLGHDEAAVEAWFNHWIKLGFDSVERLLAGDGQAGKFCHGDEPGLADLCLVPQVFNARRFPSFDMTPYPAIRRIFEECMALDAFERARPERQPDAE